MDTTTAAQTTTRTDPCNNWDQASVRNRMPEACRHLEAEHGEDGCSNCECGHYTDGDY